MVITYGNEAYAQGHVVRLSYRTPKLTNKTKLKKQTKLIIFHQTKLISFIIAVPTYITKIIIYTASSLIWETEYHNYYTSSIHTNQTRTLLWVHGCDA